MISLCPIVTYSHKNCENVMDTLKFGTKVFKAKTLVGFFEIYYLIFLMSHTCVKQR